MLLLSLWRYYLFQMLYTKLRKSEKAFTASVKNLLVFVYGRSVTEKGLVKTAKEVCDANLWWQARRPQAQGQGKALNTLFQSTYQKVIVSWISIWYK